MVNPKKEVLGFLLRLGHSWFENDSTEGPQEVDTSKVSPKVDPNIDSMVYWESQKSELEASNIPFKESAALSRIPDAVEEPFTETYYNFADLSITYLPELAKLPELNGAPEKINNICAPETPSSGAGIQTGGQDAGVVAAIVVAVISGVIIFAALIAAVMYRHYVHRNVTSMNFDNPVYRKTTEDQFALEKNGYAPGTKLYPSTVGEEAQEPLNAPATNDFV